MSENVASESKTTKRKKNLAKEREELKEGLKTKAYQTLLDIMSHPIDGINRRIRGDSKPISFEVSILILVLLVLGLGFGISELINETVETRIKILEIFNVIISYGFIILVKYYFDKLKEGFSSDFIEYINSRKSLDEIKSWFALTTDKIKPTIWGAVFSIVFSIGLAVYGRYIIYEYHGGFLGWGPFALLLLANFPIGTGGYYLWISRNFRVQARFWDFKMYEQNPSKSVAIQKFSKLLSIPVTIIAFLAALVTLAFSITRSLSVSTLVIAVICGWYPMLSIFVRNHIALANLIIRTKQNKLIELQSKITDFEREGIKSVKGIEYLKKLIDYHDHIANTPNTALNFSITFGFVNTLLLPMATLFLSNLDIILKLFS